MSLRFVTFLNETESSKALELLEGRNLFHRIDKVHKQYVLPLAGSQYISYMGLPLPCMIRYSNNPVITTFFDAEGSWIAEPPIPEASLEEFVIAKRKLYFWNSSTRFFSGIRLKRGYSC